MKFRLLMFSLLTVLYVRSQNSMIYIDNRPSPAGKYSIILPKLASSEDYSSAREFQKYFEKVIGIRPDLYRDTSGRSPMEICIGKCSGRPVFKLPAMNDQNAYFIGTREGNITIAGNSAKGTLYGVYDFLEKYAGCRFYAPGAEDASFSETVKTPNKILLGTPAFHSREVYYTGMDDQDFADKMRCDRNGWKGSEDWGLWVHTMFTLVPPDRYFDVHPEYYALMSGSRCKTQLCLSNPDVLKITIEQLKKMMADKPGAKYWSVSQMDTYGYCECKACKTIYKREGSPSGVIIEFVNKVAAAFPDKVISTLAYQFSRKAPKYIKPASNVNIMLCTIECDRGKPISSDTTKGSFYCDLRDWSKIANDILVWDYVIQFSNMIAPFPNFHVLQPNIRLFKKFNVSAVFEQGCKGTYSENQELRQYVLAKLLWNPGLDRDSLEDDFYRGYYLNAAKWVKEYNNTMEAAQIASGKPLLIYGSPVEETTSFLNPDQIAGYDQLFDKAEYSVSLDPVVLQRVQKARLPLRYAKLEIMRKNITGENGFIELRINQTEIKQSFLNQLDTFVSQANSYGVKSIHERGLTPSQYKEKVLSSCKNAFTAHLAMNKQYQLKYPVSQKYHADGSTTLTDGKRGFDNYHILWQGFEGEDFEIIIDLGENRDFNYLGAEFLQDITSWIFMPEYVEFFVSGNGKSYSSVAKVNNSISPQETLPIINNFDKEIPSTNARYIKVFAKSLINCPSSHIGHGGKSWLFTDEIMVQKRPLP